jgi:hypothetical protein
MSLGDYTTFVEETRESSNAREKVGGLAGGKNDGEEEPWRSTTTSI